MSRGTFNSSNYFTTSVTPPITVYPFSLSCWMRSTVTTTTQYGFGFVLSSGNLDHAIILLHSTGVVRYYLRRSASLVLSSTTSYAADVWNNILVVSNSETDHRIYLNGGGKNTSATNIPFPAMNTTTIGVLNRTSITGGAGWSTIAECAAWNVALTDEEAIALTKYSPLLVRTESLTQYYPCGGLLVPNSTASEPDLMRDVPAAEVGTVAYSANHPELIYPRTNQIIRLPRPAGNRRRRLLLVGAAA